MKHLLIVMTIFLLHASCSAIEMPKDIPTIEALIDLHKTIKKDEDAAMERIYTSLGQNNLITKGAKLFNKARTMLDSRLNNVYSYIVLASSISCTANSLYKLIDEYKDFTVNTYKYVGKEPFIAWYYTEANASIAREVKHCEELYAFFAASGMNVMRSSMSDKYKLLSIMQLSIDRARNIIYSANIYCRAMIFGDWKPDYIWEILNSNVRDMIVEKIIDNWKKC